MQLFNTPIPPKAISVARETLPMSDAMHGLQGMTPPNAGMYNSDDGGAMSKPYVNAQPSENQALAMQNLNQNAQSAAPQAAAGAMGKNIVKEHLLIFILGSAIVGIAGAMMVTNDGLFTPGSYRPMRYTFVIWVMVIVGGTGNNFGAILGGFAVWFLWIEAAPIGLYLVNLTTAGLDDTHALKVHLIESVPYFRFLMMGIGLLLIMRYRPKGILPEKIEIK